MIVAFPDIALLVVDGVALLPSSISDPAAAGAIHGMPLRHRLRDAADGVLLLGARLDPVTGVRLPFAGALRDVLIKPSAAVPTATESACLADCGEALMMDPAYAVPAGMFAAWEPAAFAFVVRGPGTPVEYREALRHVQYRTTALPAGRQSRTVQATVSDSQQASGAVTATVRFVENLPPSVDLNGAQGPGIDRDAPVLYRAGGPSVSLATAAAIVVDDEPLGPAIRVLFVTVLNALDGELEQVFVGGQQLEVVSYAGAGGRLQLRRAFAAPLSQAEATTLVRTLAYRNAAAEPNEAEARSLTVVVSDGSLSAAAGIVVIVEAVNDHVPVIAPPAATTLHVPEDAALLSLVLSLGATDADVCHSASCLDDKFAFFVTAAPGSGRKTAALPFGISGSSGNGSLVVSRRLDVDADGVPAVYDLAVVAVDRGVPQRTSAPPLLLRVIVDDVNDNSPVFSRDLYTVFVNETASVGTLVATVSATDADATAAHNTVTYRLREPSATLAVDGVSGEVRLIAALDYEAARVVAAVVIAADGAGVDAAFDQAVVEVRVINENDEAPVVVVPGAASAFTEPVAPARVLSPDGGMHATDPDGFALAGVTLTLTTPVMASLQCGTSAVPFIGPLHCPDAGVAAPEDSFDGVEFDVSAALTGDSGVNPAPVAYDGASASEVPAGAVPTVGGARGGGSAIARLAIEAWVRQAPGSTGGYVLAKGSGTRLRYALWVAPEGARFSYHAEDGTLVTVRFPAPVPAVGNWSHVALALEYPTIGLFVDGQVSFPGLPAMSAQHPLNVCGWRGYTIAYADVVVMPLWLPYHLPGNR